MAKNEKCGVIRRKRNGGFIEDLTAGCCVWEMHYDANGVYIGQVQDNYEDSGTIFLEADIVDGMPCVNGIPVDSLSKEKMLQAK